jgi:hypothetical protein
MRILQRLMAHVFGPTKPTPPRYKYEVADGVFVESIFPDFGTSVPMPQRGRFAPKAELDVDPPRAAPSTEKGDHAAGVA